MHLMYTVARIYIYCLTIVLCTHQEIRMSPYLKLNLSNDHVPPCVCLPWCMTHDSSSACGYGIAVGGSSYCAPSLFTYVPCTYILTVPFRVGDLFISTFSHMKGVWKASTVAIYRCGLWVHPVSLAITYICGLCGLMWSLTYVWSWCGVQTTL